MPADTDPLPGSRVVLIGHARHGSGAELVLTRHARSLVEAGCQVTGLCPDGDLQAGFAALDIPTQPIPELRLGGGPKPVAAARLVTSWVRAAPIIRRATADADLIVVNSPMALPAVRLAGRNELAVWLVHDVVVRPGLRRLVPWSAAGLAGAIAVSDVAGEFPRSLGLDVEVVRNGAPWPAAPAAPSPDRRPIVGLNAVVTPWKGHHVFLDAVADLPEVDVEIMGGRFPKDRPYVEMLARWASLDALAGRVEFLGHSDAPLDVMRRWTVAVSASVDPEAGPLSVLEAMAIGVPVVATAHGGSVEVVDGAGLLVEPDDAEALRAGIATLVADEALRRRCSEAGRAAVEERLNLDRSREAFLAAVRRRLTTAGDAGGSA